MQSVQRLQSTNSDQRRDNLAEWHWVHTVLSATQMFIYEWNDPSCIHFVSIHQMASPEQTGAHLDQLTASIKGWVSLVGWPYSRWFTHISGHPSATGRTWDRESSPVRDQRSTTVQSSGVFFLIWERADKQTYTQTLWSQHFTPLPGRSNTICVYGWENWFWLDLSDAGNDFWSYSLGLRA